MRVTRVLTGLALALLVSIPALAAEPAQTVNFEYSAGPGNTLILQWDNPWAVSCNATGDWTGNKPPTGTETLAKVSGTVTVRLTCVGPFDNKATLSWTPPTMFTDGTALPPGHVVGYRVYKGDSAETLAMIREVTGLQDISDDLSPGAHFFAVTAVGADGFESGYSGIGSKTITTPATGADVETIRVPNPPMPVRVD